MTRVIGGGTVPVSQDGDTLAAVMRRGIGGAVAVGVILQLMLSLGALFVAVLNDSILPGRNAATLWGLLGLTLALYLVWGLLDMLRARLLFDVAGTIDQRLAGDIHDGIAHVALNGGGDGDGLGPMHDADRVRAFLTGPVPAAMIDLCVMPVALLLLFALHLWLGVVALAGMVVAAGLAWAFGASAGRRADMLAQTQPLRLVLAEEGRRNAGILRAMGMGGRLRQRWVGAAGDYLLATRRVHRRSVGLTGAAQSLRLVLFALMLAIGAALAFDDRATWSTGVAAAILLYQVLSPVDRVVAGWGELAVARGAWDRLNELVRRLPRRDVVTLLPPPEMELTTEQLFVMAPGTTHPVVQSVGIRLLAGEALGIMGVSGAGKSALLNALAGIWPAARGAIRLDGAALDQWDGEDLGTHIGHVPQQAELIDGTVAQNIARFDPSVTTDAIINAAEQAGVHDMILRLGDGYETRVGRDGGRMPAGLRQRIAVARALLGNPFVVLLDDPTSNLDGDGEQMLVHLIDMVRERGGIVVVATHRPVLLNRVDHIMQMHAGTIAAFGPRGQMLQRLQDQRGAARPVAADAVLGQD